MTDFNQPIRVGGLTLPNRVMLAPLAGVSDVPFRRICQSFEAGLTSVEMLSAKALILSARRSARMCRRHTDEPNLAVQVTGAGPEEIGEAALALSGMHFDLIDLNMGCPVKKIVSRGWGAALLREPDHLSRVVRRARERTQLPLSVKVRLGFSRASVNISDTAERIAAAGADLLTIHGRTRCEQYGTPVDYRGICEGVQSARRAGDVVTVGNGDVLDASSARRMVEETGCDAVMVSRGALGNPWIFSSILGRRDTEPTIGEWFSIVMRHLDYHETYYDNARLAPILFRKHLLWYLNGYPGVKRMRSLCSVVESMDRARSLLEGFAGGLPADLPRYADRKCQGENAAGNDPKYSMDRRHDRGVGSEV
jgi:tRNA-dihydrouridine synthase B